MELPAGSSDRLTRKGTLSMRFIHAADLHIDSPMTGLTKYDGAPVAQLRNATRAAFENLVRTALDESVDLVVLAGDVFDGDWKDFNTGLFFMNQLARMTTAGIKVVVLAGNHDAASTISRDLALPAGAFKLDHRSCQTITPEELGLPVAVHGQSYPQRDVDTDLACDYPEPTAGVLNIGVLHTALNGRDGHAPYAPCTLEQLQNKGYDYWALGHVHGREVLSQSPWVVFPGNIQGRNARETGPKGFTVVTVEDGEITEVSEHHADVLRWQRGTIDASSASSMDAVVELAQHELQRLVDVSEGRLVATRLTITGSTQAHNELVAGRSRLDAAIRSASFEIGDVWIEKIVVGTTPALDMHVVRQREDAIGGLFAGIDGLRADPASLLERFGPEFEQLRDKLPDGSIDPTSHEALVQALLDAEAHLGSILASEVTA